MANKHPNTKNLISLSERTPEERNDIATKGAIASNRIKAEKRKMKEILYLLLSSPVVCNGKTCSSKEAMLTKLVQRAVNEGDLKAIEFIRNTISEQPKEIIETQHRDFTIVVQNEADKRILEDLQSQLKSS